MNYALAVLQGVLGIICFTMPGMALLSQAGRRRLPAWPFAVILAASFILSSLLIAALQLISITLFPPAASRFVARMVTAVIFFYLCRTGWKQLATACRQMGPWERGALATVAAVVLVWLLLMPLSPYPSQLTLGLGDLPGYYRVVTNLVEGRGWTEDYFIGDYLGGGYAYIKAQPILVLVSTMLFQIFGTNWYAVNTYNILAAGLLLYLVGSFVCMGVGPTITDGKRILLFTVGVTLVPAQFVLFGLGVVSAPGALAFLTLTTFAITFLTPAALRRLIIGACLVFLTWVRPEASLLAVLWIMCYGVKWLWSQPWRRRLARPMILAACLLAPVLLWANLPTAMATIQSRFDGLWIFYLKFDAAQGGFAMMYNPWSDYNRRITRANFLEDGAKEAMGNPAIGREMRAHPVAFVQFLLSHLDENVPLMWQVVSFSTSEPRDLRLTAFKILLVSLLVLGIMEAQSRVTVLVIASFLLILPALNIAPTPRHFLTVSPIIIGLALRSGLQQYERWIHFRN